MEIAVLDAEVGEGGETTGLEGVAAVYTGGGGCEMDPDLASTGLTCVTAAPPSMVAQDCVLLGVVFSIPNFSAASSRSLFMKR